MKIHSRIALFIITIGILVILGYKFILPYLEKSELRKSSDSRSIKATITIGMDSWIGYYPLCSKEMSSRLRHAGYLIKCVNDQADYRSRMKKLKNGEFDLAVATVDAFLLNGAEYRYPATIIAVLDESKGGDAIVAWKDKVSSLDILKNRQDFKIAFTPNSPSEHLLKSVGVHFDIPRIRDRSGSWRVETNGSEDALRKFKNREVDIAVLWEPDVNRALDLKGAHKLIGTEDTKRLIVDILLVNRKYSQKNPEIVRLLLRNYFRTLKFYRENPEKLAKDAASDLKISVKNVSEMVKGVSWTSLLDNSVQWFGIAQNIPGIDEGLISTIESTLDIFLENKDFTSDPVSNHNYYLLTNREFIEALYTEISQGSGFSGLPTSAISKVASVDRKFSPLTSSQWQNLREIGTLKIRPIIFQSGSGDLTFEGKQELDRAVEHLKHYPNYRMVVKGHTGTRGDSTANLVLSRERAESVVRYLNVTHNIDLNRMNFIGYGSNNPLPRKAGENERAYNYRLPRVELYLVAEDL